MGKYYISTCDVHGFSSYFGHLKLAKGTVLGDLGNGEVKDVVYNVKFPIFFVKATPNQFREATQDEVDNAYIELYQKQIDVIQGKIDEIRSRKLENKNRL